MTKTVFLSLMLVSTFCSVLYADTENLSLHRPTDSLRQEIRTTKGDAKSAAQLELALRIFEINPREAKVLAQNALIASRATKNSNQQIQAYLLLGRISEVLKHSELMEPYFDSALVIAEQTNDNWNKGEILYWKAIVVNALRDEIKSLEYLNASIQACRLSGNYKMMASSYSKMGTIFRVNGLYDRAIEYVINAKLNYEKAGFSEGNAWSAYLLGLIYSDLKINQKALQYFNEALQAYMRLSKIDNNNMGLAICYEQIGLLKLNMGDFDEAQTFITQAIDIYKESGSEHGFSNALRSMGILEYSIGNYGQSRKLLSEALKIKTERKDLMGLPTIKLYQGLCLIKEGQTRQGIETLNEGLALAISNNQKKIQLDIYGRLAEVYKKIKDLNSAFICQEKQISLQNELLSGSANIKIEQLQAVYEIDKKNSLIIELENQNKINSLIIKQNYTTRIVMIIGISISIFIALAIFWFYYKMKHKNQELNDSNAAKDKFFAIIAHDLRGPTANLAAFLEHVKGSMDEISHEQLKEVIDTLYKTADNVNGLLENLLIWAQSQLNKIEFTPVELDLNEVIQQTVNGLKQTADDKEITFKFEFTEKLIIVADLNMVQTIVRNLISNSIKFSYRGSSVRIKTVKTTSNAARVLIIDNGIGIEKSAQPKLFDISNTYHSKGTEDEKSTGLGLILVKDFVEKNNGSIAIESQKHKGTTVSFTLPLA